MEQPNEKQQNTDTPPRKAALRAKEFSEAVDRVYRTYGSDLSAFLRDVEKEWELVKRG